MTDYLALLKKKKRLGGELSKLPKVDIDQDDELPKLTKAPYDSNDSAMGRLISGNGVEITFADLEREYGTEPDWEKRRNDPVQIQGLGAILYDSRLREQGKVPPTWTAQCVCRHCGPVWLVPGTPPEVEGCPWCLNRVKGLPILTGQ